MTFALTAGAVGAVVVGGVGFVTAPESDVHATLVESASSSRAVEPNRDERTLITTRES